MRLASALLAEVLDAHGGLERWRSVGAIRARGTIGGLLPMRFPGNKLSHFQMEIQTARQFTVIHDFPQPGKRAVFDRGAVRIESSDGKPLASRDDPRSAFRGLRGIRRNVRWDPLDLAYFAGYAFWNYLAVPFFLAGEDVRVEEGAPYRADGTRFRRLIATFSPGVVTHCRRQVFFIGEDGLIRRHDFVAEPVGRWAAAALLHDEHRHVDGFVVAMRRRVLPRGPGNVVVAVPTLLALNFHTVEVESGAAAIR